MASTSSAPASTSSSSGPVTVNHPSGATFPLSGRLPGVGKDAPKSLGTTATLADQTLDDHKGKVKVLNIFPSIDTKVCQASVRRFNVEASRMPGVEVLCISADLPFAGARFCSTSGLTNVTVISTFRSTFSHDYGLTLTAGPMRGLNARAVVVLTADNKVAYTELVPSIGQEPDYAAALAAVKALGVAVSDAPPTPAPTATA